MKETPQFDCQLMLKSDWLELFSTVADCNVTLKDNTTSSLGLHPLCDYDIFTMVICTDDVIMNMCLCFLFVWYVIGQTYFTIDIYLYEYCVIIVYLCHCLCA